jgi:DNA polymerase III delta subunit
VTPAEARKQIAGGETGPLYLLEGDDLQSRHDLALEFTGIVESGLEAFNVEAFHANDATSASQRDQMISGILGSARTLPMMAPRRVVLVHDAEKLLSPRKGREEEPPPAPPGARGKPRKARALTPSEALEEYFESPEPLTTLVFVAGPLDGNRRLVKLLRKRAVTVDSGTLETGADAATWIRARLDRDEMEMEPAAMRLLLDATGLRLGRIRAEIEKLVLYASGEPRITAAHVKDLVMPQEEPSEGPAVGMAIKDGDAKRALTELNALFEAGVVAPLILGQIRWAATQLRPPARVKRGLGLVLDTDLNMKSSRGEPRYLLERLVVELCAGGSTPSAGPRWGRR